MASLINPFLAGIGIERVGSEFGSELTLRPPQLAEVDDEVGELFLMEQEVDAETLRTAIRRATLSLAFVPVFLGSAYKNKVGAHLGFRV